MEEKGFLMRPDQLEYLVLGGKTNILADERDKQLLISQVDVWRQKKRLSIYAFCLTNEEVHILMDGHTPILDAANELKGFLMKNVPGKRTGKKASVGVSAGDNNAASLSALASGLQVVHAEIVTKEEDMRFLCRKIHQIPLTYGFAVRLQDYWWSSYPSYVGIHDWKLLNKEPMLLLFGPSRGKATRQLRRYHEIPDIVF